MECKPENLLVSYKYEGRQALQEKGNGSFFANAFALGLKSHQSTVQRTRGPREALGVEWGHR